MSLVFDATRCTSCGICTSDCVCGILTMNGGLPTFKENGEKLCVHCGHCVAVCPEQAITLDGLDSAQLKKSETCDLTPCLDAFLKQRRAVRQYDERYVEQNLLEKAFACASYAPTAHNARQVSYIVINGRDKVEKLLHATVRLMEEHHLYPNHTKNVRNGHDSLFRGAPCLILIHAPERILSETDCATAASYLELAFPSFHLGSCWAGMFIEACAYGLPAGIQVPKGHKLYAALMVGKPAIAYKRIPFRTPPEIVWVS